MNKKKKKEAADVEGERAPLCSDTAKLWLHVWGREKKITHACLISSSQSLFISKYFAFGWLVVFSSFCGILR